MINHHLDHATILSYAAGSLGEALSAVASSHITQCGTCRDALELCNAMGGAMLEGADLGDSDMDKMPDVSKPALREPSFVTDERHPGRSGLHSGVDLPLPLAVVLGGGLESLKWKWLAPGIKHFPIAVSTGETGDLRLLKIEPGRMMPEHGHGGSELTLVIKGSYIDEVGQFGPGDVADLDENIEHQPVVGPDGCICLVASECPARFKSLVGRVLQPLIGM